MRNELGQFVEGHNIPKEWIPQISKGWKNLELGINTRFKEGNIPPFKGKHIPEIVKEKLRKSHQGMHNSPKTEFRKGQFSKEKHPNWKGGILPYTSDWPEIRKKIYERDNWICQECFNQSHKNINCHHKDINPINNSLENLITLCKKCHGKKHSKEKGI